MTLSRRELLAGVGGAGLIYALEISCSPRQGDPKDEAASAAAEIDPIAAAVNVKMDYREWLVIGDDGTVSAHTGRVEIGQGLTTVLSNVISQALDLPPARVQLVMGDTDRCPDDGPTTGSSATRIVGWGFWLACRAIRQDLLQLGAEQLGVAPERAVYAEGEVYDRRRPSRRLAIAEIGRGQTRLARVDPFHAEPGTAYVDRGTPNVNGEAIVTGTQQYAGDIPFEGCLYGAFLTPEYHKRITKLRDIDLGAARRVPGVVTARTYKGKVAVVGESFESVQQGLAAAQAEWAVPERPQAFASEHEIRAGAKLAEVIEERGDPARAMRASHRVISETYVTQYASPAPIETHTAVATQQDGRFTVWSGTQNPFLARFKVARRFRQPEERIRVIAAPAGGGFGQKAGHTVATEAALLAQLAQRPVRCVYTRREQFQKRSSYKASVALDLKTGLDENGRIVAREIDIFQDRGAGTEHLYRVPNARTHLHQAKLPFKRGIMRGTSYTQTCYALESHMDVVAAAAGIDPLEFRRRYVEVQAFRPLIDACAEMLDYGHYQPPPGQGIGFGICNHGGHQLGVVGAEVAVDRSTGRIRVVRLAGTFDIGLVINRNTAGMGIRGAMLWGLGYALFEEVRLDGHRCYTESFADYRVPRFSDVPPIEIAFLDNYRPGSPRGCGEMPLPPTIAAISNAVANATNVRFYTLPMTPDRVLAALGRSPTPQPDRRKSL